ncbi:MAG: DUF4330 domain-containing protein [Clostridia bacterium]|nr:DUF4330 domain-containing protein [Clostridia bacterium]
MESKNVQKSRFNFVDVIVIVLALAMTAAIVYFFVSRRTTTAPSGDKTVVYTLKLPGVNADYLAMIKENDTITDSSTGNVLGTVREVQAKHTLYVGDTVADDGKGGKTAAYSEYDNLFDVYITIYVTASVDDRGIAYIGSNRILVGSPFYIRHGAFAKKAYCTAFSIE